MIASFAGSTDYVANTASTVFLIAKATPTVTWATPADIVLGTALGPANSMPWRTCRALFTYTPAGGIKLSSGGGQLLSVDFTPTDTADYTAVTRFTTINVGLKSTTTFIVNSLNDLGVGTGPTGDLRYADRAGRQESREHDRVQRHGNNFLDEHAAAPRAPT